MSATVSLDELTPEVRDRVMKQIDGTGEATSTALATAGSKDMTSTNGLRRSANHSGKLQVMSPALVQLDKARQMLAESRTLPEVKKVRDIAEAAKVYAKAAHLGQEAQNYAAEIALLAERKAGDIFAGLERAKPKATGGRVRKSEAQSEYATALEESSTSEREAQRWQEIARIPDETFHDYIQQSKDLKAEISRAGLSKAAKKAANRKCPSPVVPPERPQVSTADITSRLTVLLFELSALNTFTKQLRYADLDEPSRAEVQSLITQLRKISKDAAERADRLQAVAS